MINVLAVIVTAILFLIGITGTLLPVLPGAPVIWLGMLVYGLLIGFDNLGLFFFVGQALLALAVMGVDYLFTTMGSRYFGGSKAALWGAAAGLLIGLMFFPIGLLIGPFLGATIADFIFRRRADQAIKSGVGASLGFWSALPIKLILEGIMITWFVLSII